ncbi:hypothetical protein [Streptomyces sp. WZ-12]|uniref:hypothetical protein n=1 Tax=Streptomyces sp. WZ-12 TaxID=3030210 RepID=UPI0023810F1D|nr:hypothetical protein [Streptomyces sp. WZ-12]
MSDCVLSYALTTVPTPLTVSPPKSGPGNEDELAYGSIDLVISNSGGTTVRCSRIAVVLPVGSLAQDLALTGEGIAPYVEPESGWTIVGPQPDVLLAVPMAETAVFPAAGEATGDSSKVRFSVEPTGGTSEVTVDGLYITLKNIAISNKTGVARIGIEEWATTGSTIPEAPNTGTLDVAKFPFRSGADPAPGVGRALVAVTAQGGPPATRIAAGDPVRLEWHHVRGDNHELYMDGERVPDASIPGGSVYPVPAGKVLRDRAFALKTVTPTPDGGFVTRWDHLTVCVTDQTLASLTVSGGLTAKGVVTAQQTLDVTGAVTAESTLDVTGNTTVGGTLKVTEQLTADGKLQANGAFETSTAGESVFHHNVTVYAPNDLVAGGGLRVDGKLRAEGDAEFAGTAGFTGAVQGYRSTYQRSWGQGQAPQSSNPYQATASTDGVLYGNIQCYDNTSKNDNIGYKGSLNVRVNGYTYRCDAPILRQSGAGAQHYALTAPVRKGDSISVYLTHDDTSIWYDKLAIRLLWRPYGADSPLSGFSKAADFVEDNAADAADASQGSGTDTPSTPSTPSD